ncbi:capping complex subunit for YIEGIA [Priestia taiwanensis]|uniref:capping complex subunit for YIEGIA n=1 Tax=Priestia taiwanensis TaxID=1347902 RepID=UPI00166E14F4|nr:hypothetical protein [Priestia taiwanensis]
MSIDGFILAVITTNPSKIAGGVAVFACETTEEVHQVTSDLEYILDGTAHKLGNEMFIIVKH